MSRDWRAKLKAALDIVNKPRWADDETIPVAVDLSDETLRRDLDKFLREISAITEEQKQERRDHLERRLAADVWNKAEDLRIEAMLEESGVKLPEMTTEEIYNALKDGETK